MKWWTNGTARASKNRDSDGRISLRKHTFLFLRNVFVQLPTDIAKHDTEAKRSNTDVSEPVNELRHLEAADGVDKLEIGGKSKRENLRRFERKRVRSARARSRVQRPASHVVHWF